MIHTLNDIQFHKCGGLFGVDAGVISDCRLEANESPSADHCPACDGHIPRETTSQLVSMNLCVQKTLLMVDVLLEEPMIN